jgi:hypothetical protein
MVMKFKLEFGSKWFYISGALVAAILWTLFNFENILIPILAAPFLIFGGAYLAVAKAGIERERWFIIMSSIYAYGIGAALVNTLFFLVLFGPLLWEVLFEINEYLTAIIGMTLFVLLIFVISVVIYSLFGAAGAFFRIRLKKE